jgi:diguanylate cyclase
MKASVDEIQRDFAVKSAEMEQLREELEHARQMASIDALTGLVNRGAFFDALEEKIECIESVEDTPLCMVMFDIDHFKRVNDNFGHLVGDKVIRFVAKTLQQSIKGLDTAARYGGEEFALLLPETAAKGAVTLCNRIRERISETNLVRTGTRIPLGQITVSAGVAEYRPGEDMMELVRRADEALYQSKRQGRNQVQAAA